MRMPDSIEFDPDVTITEAKTIDDSGYVSIGREHASKSVQLVIAYLTREDSDETSNVINSNTSVQSNGYLYLGKPYAGRTTDQIKVLFE